VFGKKKEQALADEAAVKAELQRLESLPIARISPSMVGPDKGLVVFEHSEPITSVAFDPGGHKFVTAGCQDGTIKVWFTNGTQQQGPRLGSDKGATSTAAFDPSGNDLLVVDDHGNAFTWPTSLTAWERRACSLAGRFTSAAWAQLVGRARYTRVCP
jgi:WD40 repeat protein